MKTLILSLMVFVMVVSTWSGAYFLWFQDQIRDRQILLHKIAQQECANNELEKIARENYPKKYEQILGSLEGPLEKKIPKIAKISSILSRLSQIAENTKVSLNGFQAGAAISRPNWFELPIILTIVGDFPQVMSFLDKVAGLERVIKVQDFSYEANQASLTLITYYGNLPMRDIEHMQKPYQCGSNLFDLGSIVEKPLVTSRQNLLRTLKRNPFIEPHPQMSAQGLHLVGLLEQNGTWLALLEDDASVGQIVSVGDSVVGNFVVQSIDKDSVMLIKDGLQKELVWE